VLFDAGVRSHKLILDTIIKNMKEEDESGCVAKTIFHPQMNGFTKNHVVITTEDLFYMTFSNPDRIEIIVYRTLLHEMGHCLCNHDLFDPCHTLSDVLKLRAHQVARRISDMKKYHEKRPTTDGLSENDEFEMLCDYYKMIADEREANSHVCLSAIEMANLERVYQGIPTNIVNHIETDD
jgi:hypothetical protein